MIVQEEMRVVAHREIALNIFELVLEGHLVEQITEPGQFVHIRTSKGVDPLLRRPISIASIDEDNKHITIIYRAEGKGTKLLSTYQEGEQVDVLGPLGNGFPVDAAKAGETALLVGGGIGVPPLYELAKALNQQGVRTIHVLGFETDATVFYEEEFGQLGDTYIATVDGTNGTKGFVTDCITNEQLDFDLFYSCGPIPMLKALSDGYANKTGFISLEERMGCGIGACFSCVCHLKDSMETDYVKVCSDGPVFRAGKVVL